jgi:CHAD domain-containing protein
LAKEAADARIEAAKLQAEARVDAAREAGASRLQIAQLKTQNSRDLAALAASLKGPKVLPASLQKEEDKELELVDSLTARSEALQPAVASLTPDPVTKKPPLALGPVNNLRYQAQNAAGNSTPESRAYAQLQRSVQEATNLKTDAAKGVQTDKDVLRFANELIAAFGKNDTQTTLDALSNFVKTTDKARVNTQKRIDSRRKSQGIEPYYGPQAGTPQNPIKLD